MNTNAPYRSACGYIRSNVTGLRQRVDLLEQSRRINAFCAGGQHILACTVVDTDISGGQPNLEWLLACATAPDRPFDQIIVSAAGRLARDPAALETIKARLAAADVRLIVLEAAPTVAATPMAAEKL